MAKYRRKIFEEENVDFFEVDLGNDNPFNTKTESSREATVKS